MQEIVDLLEKTATEHRIAFIHGHGKRKTIHQRYYELFRRFLDRQLLYDLHYTRFGNRNSYSKTDVDATFMHRKEEHMRNTQLNSGYNGQIGVFSEYIMAADLFQDRNDVWALVPF